MEDRTIAGGNRRRVQVRRVAERGWTRARRETFLNMLAATCNVSASIAAAGLTGCSAYRLRRRDPEFADLWRAALLEGYDRLEEKLLQHAGAGVNDIEIGGENAAVAAPFDPQLAMELLRQHRRMFDPRRGPRLSGRVVRASREEAEAALLKKLDRLAKRLADEGAA